MKRTAIVNRIKEAMKREIPQAEVVLFGSEARGDANINSDIDLLVLLPQEKVTFADKNRIIAPLYDIELATQTLINPLIYSKTYWQNRPMDYFKLNIQNEGIKL